MNIERLFEVEYFGNGESELIKETIGLVDDGDLDNMDSMFYDRCIRLLQKDGTWVDELVEVREIRKEI